jgi:branched-chain amino acid transport system substrate-binding protein
LLRFSTSVRTFVAAAASVAIGTIPSSPGVADDATIKIGLVYSYTGAPEYLSRGVTAAIAAYETIHGDTVAGKKVVIIKRDDTGIAPDIARRMAQELIVQENVDILIGAATTPNAVAIADVSTQAQKPYFIINAATSGILAKNPYAVRFGFTTAQITTPFGKWCVDNGMKTSYLLYQDYGPGIDGGTTFRRSAESAGGIVAGESRVPLTNQDYSAYIQRVKDAKPDALYAFFNYIGGLQMLKAAAAAGLTKSGTKIVSTDAIIPESEVNQYPDIAPGLISVGNYTWTHDSALNRQFVAAYKKAYGVSTEVPDFADVAAFDIMNAIYIIAKQLNGNLTADQVLARARTLAFESPRGPIRIDPDTRDLIQNAYVRRIDRIDGTLVDREIATFPMVKDPNEH